MAGFVAKKLCPHLIFVDGHFKRYSECSRQIMDILRRYDANMAPASLDVRTVTGRLVCRDLSTRLHRKPT
jgi:nucleotidyltransferase/DNA polymerase involved in DNA repair